MNYELLIRPLQNPYVRCTACGEAAPSYQWAERIATDLLLIAPTLCWDHILHRLQCQSRGLYCLDYSLFPGYTAEEWDRERRGAPVSLLLCVSTSAHAVPELYLMEHAYDLRFGGPAPRMRYG